jgi:hypothetical protein
MKTSMKVLASFFAPLVFFAYWMVLHKPVGLFVEHPTGQILISAFLITAQICAVIGMGEAGFFESKRKDKRQSEQ